MSFLLSSSITCTCCIFCHGLCARQSVCFCCSFILSWPSVLWHCWLGGRKGIQPVKNWVLAWLSVWSKVQTCIQPSWCHCHSLPLASAKSRLVVPFLYRLTRVVLDKGPLNGCVCVCVPLLTLMLVCMTSDTIGACIMGPTDVISRCYANAN